jgi:hypothetical protein
MAKSKKSKKEEVLEPIGTIGINQNRLSECEWCFQFDDDEPKIFAWTEEDMQDEEPAVTFTIANVEGAYVSFSKDGKTFKLFARPLSDEGKKLREFNNQNFVNDVRENKEA